MLAKVIHRSIIFLGVGWVTLTMVTASPANLAICNGFIGPPAPTKMVFDKTVPLLNCESAYLFDNSTRTKIYGKDEYEVRPIASITKLLTALTFLDFNVSQNKTVQMINEDVENSSRSVLRAGHVYRVWDLLHASLMGSDNRATRALARSTDVPMDSFVVCMNRKADQLGLLTISVEEPTGLSEKNVASAADVARLLNAAANNSTISSILQQKSYSFSSVNLGRQYTFGNTNRLLNGRWEVEGGKTGYIDEAGWCFVARANDRQGHDLTAVVLGANSNSQRFRQAQKLLDWAFGQLERSPY
jgi:D-alanyl-D-alanine endopeptidase (penicillin-binding protein 7)